jgi:hypothetical protein
MPGSALRCSSKNENFIGKRDAPSITRGKQARDAAMSFYDRSEAGHRLAAEVVKLKGEDVVVFALPRGGAPVAAPIAVALDAQLDLILVRNIGVPFQPELAMGAVADGGTPLIVRNEDVIAMARVSESEFEAVCQRELAEIERRRRLYLGARTRPEVRGGSRPVRRQSALYSRFARICGRQRYQPKNRQRSLPARF